MNNHDIELRLQNIVNSDALVSKQLAIKTKRIYKKLHFLGNATTSTNKAIHEKQSQLEMTEKLLDEHRAMLETLRETQTTLQSQVHRLRKKVNDLKNHKNKNEPITPDDRFVYTKNAFKKCLLGQCTKLRLHEIRTPSRTTLQGYVAVGEKLHPFTEKIAADSKQTDEATVLWNQIKLSSSHLDEWNDLFSNEGGHHTTL